MLKLPTGRVAADGAPSLGAGEVPPTSPALETFSVALLVLARAYRAMLLTLVVVAVLPSVGGWGSFLVRSGSMEPSISTGDIVVTSPLGDTGPVDLGRVMVFTNPAHPDAREDLVHRVVERRDDGTFTTQGDANAAPDTVLAPRSAFHDRARLLVPFVGLPAIWWSTGAFLTLGIWTVLTILALHVARAARKRPPASSTDPAADPPAPPARPIRRRVPLVAATAVLALVGVHPVSAAFSGVTTNPSNTWTAGVSASKYRAAVLADGPYAYHRADEATGAAAVDESGAGRTGTYTAVGAYRQEDALPGNAGFSVDLATAAGRLVTGGPAIVDPATFTLELWFATRTTLGGRLIGFGSTQGATSPSFDRHVLLRPDGRISYGGWSNPGMNAIVTPAAYNDGNWHHLVLTTTRRGSAQDSILYVDGVSRVAGPTTKTFFYAGWWRVGFGGLPTGTGAPLTASFPGRVDEVAVYQHPLSAARVASHYAAR